MAVFELLLLGLRSFQVQEKKAISAPRNISFAFWLSCLILFIPGTPVGAQINYQEWCADRGDYAVGSNFQDNLSRLLSRGAYAADNKHGFYNTTEGEDPDKVYGLFLCRGDVSTYLCQSCILLATGTIMERCLGQKEAIIWYDECLVRYSNRSFFSIMETAPVKFLVNPMNVSATFNWIVKQTFDSEDFATEVMDLARNVMDLAISSESLYATKNVSVSSSVILHELAQCTLDISKSDCKICLLFAINEYPKALTFKKGGARIFQPSCNVRYEMYIDEEPRGQAPAPSEGVKRNLRIAIISSVIGLGLLIIIVGSCIFLKRKKRLKKGIS
ncbi:hypothetical protein BT93_E1676 [Corymbia citriodora subsp. variegata]|nr:hypothetical protein BT93_E1676 [Corymbia citriodora subsp. variegata]